MVLKLNELMLLGCGDAANYFCEEDLTFRMAGLNIAAVA